MDSESNICFNFSNDFIFATTQDISVQTQVILFFEAYIILHFQLVPYSFIDV